MCSRRMVSIVMTVFVLACISLAQAPDLEPGREGTPMPVVSFELNWQLADPHWYEISMGPTGRTTYKSQPKPAMNDAAGDPFTIEFTATESTRERVFELAKQANYFKGNFEYKANNIAQTGKKTLRYKDANKQSETTFNYSTNPAITELTTLFQRMSSTMESGRRLSFSLRFDKLGVDDELKKLEQMKKMGSLVEVQALEPLLRKIIEDRSFMNVSRQRAQRLLGVSVSPAGSR